MVLIKISYIGFILFPVRGPRYEFAHLYQGPLTGYIITTIQNFVMKLGSTYGGCMPSSHVAAACVSLIMLLRYARKLIFFIILPVVFFLCISTVYCRYHYTSDVVAGLLVCLIALYLRPLINEYIHKTVHK